MNARVPLSARPRSRSGTGGAAFASGRAGHPALGRTLAENSGHFFQHGQRGIHSVQRPVKATGATAGLKGKRAPVGATRSVAGMLVSGLREPMWCSAHEEALLEAMSCEFQTGTRSGRVTETYCDAVY
jgi:hypothetical protein